MDKRFVIVAGVLMYLITAYFSFDFFSNRVTTSKTSTTGFENVNVDKAEADIDFQGPLTEECPINGEKLTKEHKARWEKRRPLGVMIENHLDARDQSGISRSLAFARSNSVASFSTFSRASASFLPLLTRSIPKQRDKRNVKIVRVLSVEFCRKKN
jgi:hypothetical protein